MIEQIVTVLHVLIAISIIGLILLQQGKGADMGASFGGGSSQTLFGAPGGGSVLPRITAILVALFFATSFGLAIIAKQKVQSLGTEDFLIDADSVPAEIVSEVALPEGIDALDSPDAIPEDILDDLPLGEGELVPEAPAGDDGLIDEIPE